MEHKINIVESALNDLAEAFGDASVVYMSKRSTIKKRLKAAAVDHSDFSLESDHNHRRHSHDKEGDMSDRIINLESQVSQLRVDMAEVKTKVTHIESSMLTKGQAATSALIAVLSILAGGWWVVQQYLAPILQATGTN